MTFPRDAGFSARMVLPVFLGVIGLVALAFLSVNVARDLRLLDSAKSDNVQWTLSQAEVEYLEFDMRLETASRITDPDLDTLRRAFDIFYSRITTLRDASIYAPLRALPEFEANLLILDRFLGETVELMDAGDEDLEAALPAMMERAAVVRVNVRKLSNSGLNYFANESDRRRARIAVTLGQLAAGVTLLVAALLVLAVYLAHLNRLNNRRRAEAIQASERMKLVTSTALDAVVVADKNGVVLDFNAAATQIFGCSPREEIGRALGDLIVPVHHRAAHEAGMRRMRERGEKRFVGKGRKKLDAVRKNGEVFPVEFAIEAVETDEGMIFVSFLRDISRRVAAEAELVLARDRALAGEKAKSDFLATMSHEIRTPLNGLLGNLALLGETPLSEDQKRYVKYMDTSGKLLMSHISDVLDITKYDAGKLSLRPVVMNISTLVQDILDNQSGAAMANDTSLEWDWCNARREWIYADKERIQHILMNVIGNAVKFTQGGTVRVQAEVIGKLSGAEALQITVRDTGIGMEATLKAQIFDDFMTGDVTYTRDVGGTGLGLGIAQRFVKALGGTIEVESETGKGSVFVVRFPVLPAEPPEDADLACVQGRKISPGTILLADDNEINRAVARQMLVTQGHHVVEARDGKIAVALAQEQRFDLILMDISMPVMDGRAATRAIRAGRGPSFDSPIVALTANAMASEQAAFLSDGVDCVLTKPLAREAFDEAVSRYCGADGHARRMLSLSAPIVDAEKLTRMHEHLGGLALERKLEKFGDDVDKVLEFFRHSAALPLASLAQRAHSLSESAATFGAVALRKSLIEIEEAARRGDAECMARAVSELPSIWSATRPRLTIPN
jgi:PAS domain S-box-containing protein